VQKRERRKSLFVSRFSPEVTTDVETSISIQDQLQLASFTCARLKTKYNSYASFLVSLAEDDFRLINNTGVWPKGFLITPYYGRLNSDKIYSFETPATSRHPTPGVGRLYPPTLSPRNPIGDSINTDGERSCTKLKVNTRDSSTSGSAGSHTKPGNCFDVFYQNVRGLRTEQLEHSENVCSTDYNIICLSETSLNDLCYEHILFPDCYSFPF
jgi:hypothetical protein